MIQGGIMNYFIKKIGLLSAMALGLVITPSLGQASLLIEPHLSYNIYATGENDNVDTSYNGPQYGLKLGYQYFGLMVGMDYRKSNFETKFESNNVTSRHEMKRDEIGIFAGYEFPILVRGWVGYYFSNKTKFKEVDAEYKGSTTELGVGFTTLPFLSVNFMYRMVKLDELSSSSLTVPAKSDANEFVVGISLPLNL